MTAVVDHLTHLADAFCALGGAAVARKDIARPLGAGLDGEGDVTLAQTIAVADVHAASLETQLRLVLHSRSPRDCNAFASHEVDLGEPLSHLPPMRAPDCQLYLLTPPVLTDLEGFSAQLQAALDAGPVAALQIRLKPADDQTISEAVRRLAPFAQSRGVAVILDDRPDLAASLGCDGVHVGQSDASVASARRIMGKSAMIGATCHDSLHLGMEAAEAGADYVAFGAFFPTDTKATSHRPDPDILSIWQEAMEVPCVAIGGITVDNASILIDAGADFLAVSQGVWGHPEGPARAVERFTRLMSNQP